MSSRGYSSSSGGSRSTTIYAGSNTTYTQDTSHSGGSSQLSAPIVHNKGQSCNDGWSSSKNDDKRYYKGSFNEQKRDKNGYYTTSGGRR